MPHSAIIVEDDEPTRELWCRSIKRSKDFTLHSAFEAAEDALAAIQANPPDFLIADWRLARKMNGIALVALATQAFPALRAIVISGYTFAELPPEALLAGADSFLRKPVTGRELLQAMRQVLAGQCPFSQPAVELLRERLKTRAPDTQLPLGPLSAQEHRVLTGLALGHAGKQVAGELGLAWGTFQTYRNRAFKKLQAHSLSDALCRLRTLPPLARLTAPAAVILLHDMTRH